MPFVRTFYDKIKEKKIYANLTLNAERTIQMRTSRM